MIRNLKQQSYRQVESCVYNYKSKFTFTKQLKGIIEEYFANNWV